MNEQPRQNNQPQQRVAVLIDGSNFYFKLKDLKLHKQLQFDFTKFLNFLAGRDKLVSCTYYIGKIRTDGTKRTQELFDLQRKLLAHLQKHKVNYSLGYLLKSSGRYQEKGVDVHMAVDIVAAAYENTVDKLIVVSSDSDLLPAIERAQKLGKKIEYIGFTHQPSMALKGNSDTFRFLDDKDIKPFVQDQPQQKRQPKSAKRRR